MATEVLKALFTAKDNISDALDNISASSDVTSDKITKLQRSLGGFKGQADVSDESMEELESSLQRLTVATSTADRAVEEYERSLQAYNRGAISADQLSDDLTLSFARLAKSADVTEESAQDLGHGLINLARAGKMSSGWMDRLTKDFAELTGSTHATEQTIDNLMKTIVQQSMAADHAERATEDYSSALAKVAGAAVPADIGSEAVAGSMDDMGREASQAANELDEVSRSSLKAAGTLTLLNSAVKDSILEFGSLSVNIGPFNLALRNFVTQVPAILTGMGSMLALVTSLIVAFTTLAAVSGALVVGGAIAFFEQFSEQFEEAGEAVEAITAALKNLFVEALSPIINEANMDLFVDTLNSAAEVVNRFAQFVSFMRDEVLQTLGAVEGDLDDFFNAMRNTFILLEPVLIGFMNFFMQDLPLILERFAVLTATLDSDIKTLINTFGALLNQLLDFASSILAGLAPAIKILVGLLTVVFAIINKLPEGLIAAAVFMGIFAIVAAKTVAVLTGLAGTLITVNSLMIQQAASGTFLGGVYSILNAQLGLYIAGQQSLVTALTTTIAAIGRSAIAHLGLAKARVLDSNVTKALVLANSNLIKMLKSSAVWLQLQTLWTYLNAQAKAVMSAGSFAAAAAMIAETIAITGAALAMAAYTAITTAAATATNLLTGALAILTAPISATAAAIIVVIGVLLILIDIFTNGAISGAIGDFFSGLIDWIGGVIDSIKELIGLTGGGTGVPGVADPDAIQTNPNVNLSFKDEINQQVDVQADPEDKEGLRRIVKDAMNEANSVARRTQGGGR